MGHDVHLIDPVLVYIKQVKEYSGEPVKGLASIQMEQAYYQLLEER